MPLHPQAAALLELIAMAGDPELCDTTPDAARTMRRSRYVPPTVDIHEVREIDAGGVPARLYRPSAAADLGVLVYVHGGGWVLCDLDSHDQVCRILANDSGHAVLSIDYRLAPEHPFPAGLEDVVTALRWTHEHAGDLGCDPTRIAIGGDSAGGNLAAVAAQIGPVPLVFQLLVYPVTDATQSQPSYVRNAEGYGLTASSMTWFIDHYLSGPAGSREDPRVSPLLASDTALAATPPALVITAELDPLCDEGDAYAARLAAVGVPTSHVRFNGMIHAFFSMADFLDDGHGANALAAAFVRTAFDR